LKKQGLVETNDIAYFTTLNDYWSYGHFPDRESGKVLKFSLTPMYAMKTDKSNYYNTQYSGKFSLLTDASFNCTKQLNLNWERKLSAWISNETLIDTTGEDFSYFPNFFRTGASLGYGFYPDSRTSISGNLGYSGQNNAIYSARNGMPNQWINRVFVNFGGYYYLSPQLQITGSFSMNYSDKNYNEINPFYLTYNLGLRYAIF
jgi:hypothetical protein